MAGRKVSRDEAHTARRRAFYLAKLQVAGPSEAARVAAASDYLRALLKEHPDPQLKEHIGERVVGVLLSAASALEPPATKRRRGGRR